MVDAARCYGWCGELMVESCEEESHAPAGVDVALIARNKIPATPAEWISASLRRSVSACSADISCRLDVALSVIVLQCGGCKSCSLAAHRLGVCSI
jgi:hypothetical protein